LPFLTEVFARYDHATTYYLEMTYESQLKSEYMRNWYKTTQIAAVGPKNQYRFHYRGEFGQAFQVSDGTTEWIYAPGLNQYTQQPTPADGPSKIHTSASMALDRLSESHSTVHSIAHRGDLIQRATFAPDQDIQIGDQTIPCVVVTTEGVLPGWGGHTTTAFTFWVEKQSGLIRKSLSRTVGELMPSAPGAQCVSESETTYTIATPNPSSFPDATFTFTPPANAVLVKEFSGKQAQEQSKLVGKALPAVTLKDSAGREVSLQSFQGKPLLLDFWATWCVPCRESLPTLQKLYTEYKDKGLVLLSLDEDEAPQKATDFWARNKLPWPNYHLDKPSVDKFPQHGIPYFVLVDPSGKILFSQAGAEEKALRTALASLDSAPSH
jgi:thiol-disulfide isomerase/thioredoxin